MCRRLTTHPYWQWEPSDPLIYLCALSQWEVSSRGARLVWQMRPGRPGNLDPLYKDGQFWATQRLLPSATRQQRNTTTVWTFFFFFWSSRQGPKDVFDKVQSLKKIHNSAQVWVTETKETKTRQSLCVPHTHTHLLNQEDCKQKQTSYNSLRLRLACSSSYITGCRENSGANISVTWLMHLVWQTVRKEASVCMSAAHMLPSVMLQTWLDICLLKTCLSWLNIPSSLCSRNHFISRVWDVVYSG